MYCLHEAASLRLYYVASYVAWERGEDESPSAFLSQGTDQLSPFWSSKSVLPHFEFGW